jgi:hypothetical protein
MNIWGVVILVPKIKHNNGALRIWFLKTDLQNKVIRVHMYLQQSYEWEILEPIMVVNFINFVLIIKQMFWTNLCHKTSQRF